MPSVFRGSDNFDTAGINALRAWVNFDGVTTPPTIRASGNVSSVARNSTGNFTVNFTTALPDADYSCVFSKPFVADAQNNAYGELSRSSSSVQLQMWE